MEKFKSIIYNVTFKSDELHNSFKQNTQYNQVKSKLINDIGPKLDYLDKNGILFLYGNPLILSPIVDSISKQLDMDFRYWIAIDSGINTSNKSYLSKSHIACVMFTKKQASKFDVDTDSVRTPRYSCLSCGRNTKDWGGKKHLINKKGAAISDVWKDYYKIIDQTIDPQIPDLKLLKVDPKENLIRNSQGLPKIILERLIKLSKSQNNYLLVDFPYFKDIFRSNNNDEYFAQRLFSDFDEDDVKDMKNKVFHANSINLMKKLVKKYPDGLFDLIFADPPYNLDKKYDQYNDESPDEEYLNWSKEWLKLSIKLLKPNGHFFVLNIPKWGYQYANYLSQFSYLSDWIVWDSLSIPKGKIMPAHYSLLHFTKKPLESTDVSTKLIEPSGFYCSKISCKKKRESNSIKVPISNIWSDIHRIKHRRDRDAHPCQLPDRLMQRIIEIYTNPDDLVFDPFNGVGTTAYNAMLLHRNFITSDLSKEYVKITNDKLNQIKENGYIKKESTKITKSNVTKRAKNT